MLYVSKPDRVLKITRTDTLPNFTPVYLVLGAGRQKEMVMMHKCTGTLAISAVLFLLSCFVTCCTKFLNAACMPAWSSPFSSKIFWCYLVRVRSTKVVKGLTKRELFKWRDMAWVND